MKYHKQLDANELAGKLGVSAKSLLRLQAGRNCTAYTFPMKDAAGKIIGIRLRCDTGKFSVKGSRSGLFIPLRMHPRRSLFICEGPTDTAALLDMGFEVIGRPSCLGGVDYIKAFVDRFNPRQVLIMADRDEPKQRPDGSEWKPGQHGAKRLAEQLEHDKIKILKPPFCKDIRQWYREGASRARVIALAEGTRYER